MASLASKRRNLHCDAQLAAENKRYETYGYFYINEVAMDTDAMSLAATAMT